MNIKEAIKELTNQVDIKKISTIDLVEKLKSLQKSVNELEEKLESKTKRILNLGESLEKAKEDLIPTNEINAMYDQHTANVYKLDEKKKEFKEEKFKFDVEKEYIKRENNNLGEILSSMLAVKKVDYNDNAYNSNGGNTSMNYNENPVKPNLMNLSNRSTKKDMANS